MVSIKKILFVLVLVCLGKSINCQEYNYIHYTNKDGLAGNTVYGVAQDKDGYMFFATENGLSRFDGKEWKTFTVKDGLPDNEVLSIYCDKLNRLWIFTFNNKVCYLKQGIFYTEKNDSLVSKLKFRQPFQGAYESCDSCLWLVSNYDVFGIKDNILEHKWFSTGNNQYLSYILPDTKRCKVLLAIQGKTFEINGNKIEYNGIDPYYNLRKKKFLTNRSFPDFYSKKDTFKYVKFLSNYYDLSIDNYIETNNGCIFINEPKHLFHIYLPGKKVGHHLLDREDNHWFTTMGEGVYKLGSSAFRTHCLGYSYGIENREVFAIGKSSNRIIGGLAHGKIGLVDNNKKIVYNDYLAHSKFSKNDNYITRLVGIFQHSNATMLGFDNFLLKTENNQTVFNYDIQPNKSIELLDSINILVATSKGLYTVSIDKLKVTDTIYRQRVTYANYSNSQYYTGTTNGLYVVNESKQQKYLGDIHNALKRRITCIKNYDNNVYVATADAGIVVLNNDKVIATINDSTGLSNNSIKTLHINGTTLWAGTIKGINKIDLKTNKIITKYTTSDGLPSDIINAIYYDNADSTVWVGSPEGLTYFKEKDILGQSICNLVIENIAISKTSINRDSNNFSLKYNDNIQFQFVGISLRSGDEIIYHYKLQGLDENKNTTTERFLSYPSLPPGKYTLVLYATNKFGVKSKTYTCTFLVNPPFWKTWWFYTLEFAVIVFIVWLVLYTRFKRKKKEYKRIADFKVQIVNMEQQALQAQMNPHFIFNCLNSIQQFILSKQNDKAFTYLLQFSSLVRSTLDNSEKQYITLNEEIEYLKQYLSMEDLRFGEQFTFEVIVEEKINTNDCAIPAMILQPFVENALRHGIRQLENRKGKLKIEFHQSETSIICTVEDNGIGRKAAQKYKSSMHVTYQSKGMDLTQRRINLLNENKEQKIIYSVIDLENEDGESLGTRVVVEFPLSLF